MDEKDTCINTLINHVENGGGISHKLLECTWKDIEVKIRDKVSITYTDVRNVLLLIDDRLGKSFDFSFIDVDVNRPFIEFMLDEHKSFIDEFLESELAVNNTMHHISLNDVYQSITDYKLTEDVKECLVNGYYDKGYKTEYSYIECSIMDIDRYPSKDFLIVDDIYLESNKKDKLLYLSTDEVINKYKTKYLSLLSCGVNKTIIKEHMREAYLRMKRNEEMVKFMFKNFYYDEDLVMELKDSRKEWYCVEYMLGSLCHSDKYNHRMHLIGEKIVRMRESSHKHMDKDVDFIKDKFFNELINLFKGYI